MLRRWFPEGTVTRTGDPKELVLHGELEGPSAEELNRQLLTELRRIERRTRFRTDWSAEGRTEKFIDYASKGERFSARAVR